jgi:glycine dehydrogenase subunit 1
VRVPDARSVHRRLLDRGVLAGLALADVEPDDPAVADALLVCATELTTAAEIDRFAAALSAELVGRSGAGERRVAAEVG